jgi:AAHS family 4-hydroxybenzoate transporter-like MFS transporter
VNAPRDAPDVLDVGEAIDNSQVRPLHYGIFAMCALGMIMDGFDIQALGYVAPTIIQEWKIAPSMLGPVFGASNLGVLVGQLSFTMLADRIGRRPVLIWGTVAFSLLTILTARATSVGELLAMRFLAGTALGSIVPNVTALISEFSPRRVRIQMLTYIGIGFTVGAALGGFIAAALIPAFGWRSVFYVGGVAPLIIAAMMTVWLPESLQMLVLRNRKRDYVGLWLKKLDPSLRVTSTTRFLVKEENRNGIPVMHLLQRGRAVATILLWIVFFMNLFNLYSLSNWLPTVVRSAGYPTSTAVLVGTMLQVGGLISPFLMAWLILRKGFFPVLTATFLICTGSIALIGQPGLSLPLLVVIVFITGACVAGVVPSLNALCATYYPTYLRSTGLGWALGIGRAGSIIGPVMAGQFMAWKWTPQAIFMALALPALTSAIVVVGLRFAMGSHPAARPTAMRAAAE